ncbi:MAG: sulfatase-like hydrolase/transferase, partial [bacterium]
KEQAGRMSNHYPPEDAKGFQYVKQMEEGRLGKDEPYFKWLKKKHPEIDDLWNYQNREFEFTENEYHESWIAAEAEKYIKKQVNSNPEKPFLSWISFQGPHSPLDPPSEVKGLIDRTKLPQPLSEDKQLSPVARYRKALNNLTENKKEIMKMREAYAEIIVEIDKQIGRILDLLKELDIFDNTTIIFSADHGDLLGDYGLNAKGPYPYRGQLNIPLMLSNHPEIISGTRSDILTGNIDIPGTILDIAGSENSIGFSRSLLKQVQEDSEQREVIFSEFCDSIKTVDSKKYRFCYHPFIKFCELYDKENDPGEVNNLAGREKYAEIEKEMLAHIIDFGILSKGIRIEAHDFVPEQQEGVRKKYPDFEKDFRVAFPLSKSDLKKLREKGLSTEYNEFMKEMDIINYYAKPYWEEN